MNDNNSSGIGGMVGIIILLCVVFSKSCDDNVNIKSVGHFLAELSYLVAILGVVFVAGCILYGLIKLGTVSPAKENKSEPEPRYVPSESWADVAPIPEQELVPLDEIEDIEALIDALDEDELAAYLLRNKL